MTSISEIAGDVERISDERLKGICHALIQALAKRLDDRSIMWTFKGLSEIVGTAPDDPVFLESVQLLASRPRAKLLDVHFLYFDPDDDDSIGVPLDDQQVADAYQYGFLDDPNGKEIFQFEDALVPYFQISNAVNK